jgi:hypothetical protein
MRMPNRVTHSRTQNQKLSVDNTFSEVKPQQLPQQSLGVFSEATDETMYPGVDSASKNAYQDIPGGKDDWCVRLTTLLPSCAERQ